ncbi:Os10g0439166, partial [Oryza sativa Japonica Group]
VELLVAGEGRPELPPLRHDAVDLQRLAAGGGDPERQRLPDERRVALPVRAPVPRQRYPPRLAPLHRHRLHRPAAGDVGDEHQLEVVEPGDCEPHPSLPPALHPKDGDDAGAVDADGLPGGLGHVEVGAGRVAPAAVVVGEGPVGGAEVGGGDGDGGAGLAPLGGLGGVAHDEVALPARRAAVEQRRAQRRVVHA